MHFQKITSFFVPLTILLLLSGCGSKWVNLDSSVAPSVDIKIAKEDCKPDRQLGMGKELQELWDTLALSCMQRYGLKPVDRNDAPLVAKSNRQNGSVSELTTLGQLADLVERIIKNNTYPTLPRVTALNETGLFDLERYESLKLSEYALLLPDTQRLIIAYGSHKRYPDELTMITVFAIRMMSHLMGLLESEEYDPGQMDHTKIVRGFSDFIIAATNIASSINSLSNRNRKRIFVALLESADVRWEALPITSQIQFLIALTGHVDNEPSRGIKRLIEEFLSDKDMEQES